MSHTMHTSVLILFAKALLHGEMHAEAGASDHSAMLKGTANHPAN